MNSSEKQEMNGHTSPNASVPTDVGNSKRNRRFKRIQTKAILRNVPDKGTPSRISDEDVTPRNDERTVLDTCNEIRKS